MTRRAVSVPTLVLGVLLLAGAVWLAYEYAVNRGDVRVQIAEVGGFTDDAEIWMPFRVTLRLTNDGARSTAVRRIDVEPDLEGYNEAFGSSSPFDLSPPILLEPGASATRTIVVTLFNAAQLQEGTYRLVFRVRLDTDDGEVTAEFPGAFEHTRDPSRRVLHPDF